MLEGQARNEMKKSYRVKKEAEFQKVFHEGSSMGNRQFVVYVLDKASQEHIRVGLSVGKKMGNAVMRNSIKRKIRHSLQELSDQLKEDKDFIVIARRPTSEMNYEEIKKSLIHVLSRVNMLK